MAKTKKKTKSLKCYKESSEECFSSKKYEEALIINEKIVTSYPKNIYGYIGIIRSKTHDYSCFLEDDDIKQSDYFYYGKAATLGSKDVAEQYVEWDKKEYLKGDDADCIKDYFVLSILYSKYLPNKLFGSVGTSDIID